ENAVSLNGLATLHQAVGAYPEAQRIVQEALRINRHNLDLVFATHSERAVLAMIAALHRTLDNWLNLTLQVTQPAGLVYSPLLTLKGIEFQRQRRLRIAAERPELAAQFEELDS